MGDLEDIDPDAGLFGTGLGLDSLDALEVLIALDVDLGIKLEGDDPMKLGLRSVNGVVDAVMRYHAEVRGARPGASGRGVARSCATRRRRQG